MPKLSEQEIGFLKPGETLDDLTLNGMKIIQREKGYRFSMDSVLLAHFARAGGGEKVLDLGCGSGVIAILIAGLQPQCIITGLEVQPDLADRAKRSVELNGLSRMINIVSGSLQDMEALFSKGQFDLVVTNPPFWRIGEGKTSQDNEKLIARHEVHVTLADFIKAASYAIKPGGRLAMVQRAARFSEIMELSRKAGLPIKRIRFIHPGINQNANLVLAEAWKGSGGDPEISPPLIVYDDKGKYTSDIMKIYFEKGEA
ncbi:MAG: tRNA1(Val) (adenine(37)-N6)-methyltransferase [Chitinophagales bacterium]